MPSDPVFFDRQLLAEVPWKNGGGRTQELVAWSAPSAVDGFDWRVSVATLEKDGPFSVFEGLDRSITLLEGPGMHLLGDGLAHALIHRLQPFAFAGENALKSTLRAGGSICFNVMTRRGRCAAEIAVMRERCEIEHGAHGLFLVADGRWQVAFADAQLETAQVLSPGQGFWWASPRGLWRLDPVAEGAALVWVTIRGLE